MVLDIIKVPVTAIVTVAHRCVAISVLGLSLFCLSAMNALPMVLEVDFAAFLGAIRSRDL
jgi:hypothetical protein